MTLSFKGRILLGAVLTALLALGLIWASLTVFMAHFAETPRLKIPQYLSAACQADPETWRFFKLGPVQLSAYDSEGRSPSRPPAPEEVMKLDVGQWFYEPSAPARWTRQAESGPCAIYHAEIGPPNRLDVATVIGSTVGTCLAILFAGLCSYFFTLRPLLNRVDRLQIAAAGVGEQNYVSAEDHTNDTLSAISAVLDRSNQRLHEARDELLRRHLGLERYIAEIAHDLRTPLASLMLALGEVEATETATEPMRRAISDTEYITALVENLHQGTRMRHGLDIRRGTCDLSAIVNRVELRFRALGAAREVEVASSTLGPPVIVRCEPALLERAVANLIHNGVVHGGKHVAVLLDQDGDRFTLTIMDDGPGLPSETRSSLSERTFSSDPARPRSQSLGIAITNEIVQRLGWHIQYEEGPEGGLCVRIEGTTHTSPSPPTSVGSI